jgi:phosphatidylserine/phosphatidylglycerophosphate/cardiolipin synthase-like enzyme
MLELAKGEPRRLVNYGLKSLSADDLIRELVNAKKRGVDVKVVIEYRTYYGYMSDNLKAHEYLSSNGVTVKLDQEDDTDHLKLVVVDGKIVYVGSHNWSESSLYYNRESSIKVVSEEVARQFLEYLKGNYGF